MSLKYTPFRENFKFVQKAIILHPEDNNKFLTLQRASNSKTRPFDWDFAGGNVDPNENHLEALDREVFEETGIKVHKFEIIDVQSFIINSIYGLYLDYIGIAKSTKVLLSNEHIDYKWLNLNELNKITKTEFILSMAHKAHTHLKHYLEVLDS